jgi:Uncharacterised nucleotidyltransferase
MDTCHMPTVDDAKAGFYVDALGRLGAARIPFLIGGAFALARYTTIDRNTKDIDLYLRASDMPATLALMEQAGYRTELPFPHWLAKVHCNGSFMDLIFSSGNGLMRVDDLWFEHAVEHEVLGMRVRLCPPEEMVWSKAFIQERERFDGADVMHLLRERGPRLDWPHLLARFGDHWPVLFSHIVMFRYVYPDRHGQVPAWVVDELTRRLASVHPEPDRHVCRGTLLSREQYLNDIEQHGYEDARVVPHGAMTPAEREIWTAAIADRK